MDGRGVVGDDEDVVMYKKNYCFLKQTANVWRRRKDIYVKEERRRKLQVATATGKLDKNPAEQVEGNESVI